MSTLTAGDPRPDEALDHTGSRAAGAPYPTPIRVPRHQGRPPLRLVEPARRPRRVRVGLVSTLCLVAVFAGLFALAAMHSLVVQAQFELDRLDEQVADRRSEIDARRAQVARTESPAAVVAAARELGMVVPPERVVLMPESPAGSEGSAPGHTEVGSPVGAASADESADGTGLR